MANILIIEDDLYHLELLAEIIKFSGHKPLTANNHAAAYKILRETEINLIITDISLLNESGLDFIEKLKEKKLQLPFIVVSGSTDKRDREQAARLHALAFLNKPVDPQALLTLMSKISSKI